MKRRGTVQMGHGIQAPGSSPRLPSLIRFPTIRKLKMLYTIAIVLIILWLLGMVTSVAAGGLIHILLVVAVIVILIRVISGRKVL